jgi:hypothetical protein
MQSYDGDARLHGHAQQAWKSRKEIKVLVNSVCTGKRPYQSVKLPDHQSCQRGGKSISDQRHSNAKKTRWTNNTVVAITAMEESA